MTTAKNAFGRLLLKIAFCEMTHFGRVERILSESEGNMMFNSHNALS
jgi:hypothetical protein